MPGWYDKLTRPGRSNRSATHGKDVHLPAAGKGRKVAKPDVLGSFGKAAKGFGKLRELTKSSRSQKR